MARPTTKTDLLNAAKGDYQALNTLISSLSEQELTTVFDFSEDEKKKEAHWKRDKNLRDVLIHLYEWQMLLLNWIASNQKGEKASFLPKPYNWRNYGQMNVEFWKKHQKTSLEEAKILLENSQEKRLALAQQFSNEDLFTKGVFDWVGGTTLGAYFVSATSSHYDWAIKKLKAHQRKCQQN
ncbi:ClbS/DfsB family four-helix bundle protein [Streptococcus troglodytae]|uniref:Lin2532-like protein n=1 Tax=Streptococcus troglodytae TaxID=1111760 RepID=A0A1L7LIE9_9STRE|nr:ClbS/DfsB family four-helix bundle protein [Streptococcus troglodytae]BAQ23910.1 Lin2532-like protein [Streptococcus troglodytae]